MGVRVGIKSGCFTLLHAGHVWALNECRRQCDYLIVLTNTDRYLMRKKGVVPIALPDRMFILQNLRSVDEVGTFEGLTEEFWITDFKEKRLYQEFGNDAKLIVFHSAEMQGRPGLPAQFVADEIIFIPKDGRSVSKIFKQIGG